jgi:3-deoxy-7-phosphoheptulonate synthase
MTMMTAEPVSNSAAAIPGQPAAGAIESPSVTDDVRIRGYAPLQLPGEMKSELPVNERAADVVREGRRAVEGVLSKNDPRLLVITGPCSIHDEAAALDYARRLCRLRDAVADTLLVVMRVYFEKPRTTVGWKGLISDPALDGTCDMQAGMKKARRILLAINGMGMPVATEMLEPFTPQYTADLVCWSAIGARTTESQTHREMASGLSMPVGFKNGTDGNLSTAVNALLAARAPQTFLGIDQQGPHQHRSKPAAIPSATSYCGAASPAQLRSHQHRIGAPQVSSTRDCPSCHRGGLLPRQLHEEAPRPGHRLARTWSSSAWHGNDAIVGMMLESNLNEGNQKYTGDRQRPGKYGVSITDECISWETTESLLLSAHDKIKRAG